MNEAIKYIHREPTAADQSPVLTDFCEEEAQRALNYHKSFPEYRETPLADLKELAACLGIAGFYVKDESSRFDLNAFKCWAAATAWGDMPQTARHGYQ